jgi:hypothetical protein
MIGVAFWIVFWLITILVSALAFFLLIRWTIVKYHRHNYGRNWFGRDQSEPWRPSDHGKVPPQYSFIHDLSPPHGRQWLPPRQFHAKDQRHSGDKPAGHSSVRADKRDGTFPKSRPVWQRSLLARHDRTPTVPPG